MLVVTVLQGMLPFISKAVIDVGIKTSDRNFINMVLIGNICILLSVMIFNVLRDWILLHITARVNIALISDYLIKLMKLPVTFFENKLLGDILQRAQDHERIRSFIMNNSLALIFSTLTFAVFSIILLIYNSIIFYIFLSGSVLYVCWVLLFLSIRKNWIGNILNFCPKTKAIGWKPFRPYRISKSTIMTSTGGGNGKKFRHGFIMSISVFLP